MGEKSQIKELSSKPAPDSAFVRVRNNDGDNEDNIIFTLPPDTTSNRKKCADQQGSSEFVSSSGLKKSDEINPASPKPIGVFGPYAVYQYNLNSLGVKEYLDDILIYSFFYLMINDRYLEKNINIGQIDSIFSATLTDASVQNDRLHEENISDVEQSGFNTKGGDAQNC